MTEAVNLVLIAATYKIFVILVGLCFGYMGYKLFMSGIVDSNSDVDANFRDTRVILKQVAPGTFFALFGTIVVGFAVFTGIKWESDSPGTTEIYDKWEPKVILPDKPPFNGED